MIENAFQKLMGSSIDIIGCGRTDTGVHAKRYYANFETDVQLDPEIVYKLNAILPPDIGIEYCKKTEDGFHARYSAISREYRYFIHWQKDPFLFNRSFFYLKN